MSKLCFSPREFTVRRIFRCVRQIAAGLVVLFGCSSNVFGQSKDPGFATPIRVRIATPGPSLSYFPVQVASQKGFFKKQGIEVEYVQMSSGPVTVSALMNREIDYTTIVGPSATAAVNGAPLKVICFTSVKLQHSLISRPEINSPKDLNGKRIGVGSLRDVTWYEVQYVIEKYGLRDVKIIAAGQNQRNLAAMQAGAVEAAIISPPYDLKAIDELGLKRLIRMGEILPIPQVGLVTYEDKIKKNRDEVLRVLRATIDGLEYVKAKPNREEVIQMAAKWIKLTPAQSEKAFSSVEDTYSSNCIPTAEQAAAYLPMLKATTQSTSDISPAMVFSFALAETAAGKK
jgi:NitT/TauT family transport system substrate-binding protein